MWIYATHQYITENNILSSLDLVFMSLYVNVPNTSVHYQNNVYYTHLTWYAIHCTLSYHHTLCYPHYVELSIICYAIHCTVLSYPLSHVQYSYCYCWYLHPWDIYNNININNNYSLDWCGITWLVISIPKKVSCYRITQYSSVLGIHPGNWGLALRFVWMSILHSKCILIRLWLGIDCLSLYVYTNRRAQSCLVLLQTVCVH